MSDQRFAVDEIELRQSCQQVFAVPVVTVGNVVKVFRSVNMQTTACGFHGFTQHLQTGIRHGKRRVSTDMCFHQIRLGCCFLRLINLTGEADVFFYTFLQLFDAVVTVSSFKTGHRAQANF